MLGSVLIIHPEGNSYNNPTMKCLIDLLRDRDIDLHIMHQKTIAPMPPYRGVVYHSWGRLFGKLKKIALSKFSSKTLSLIVTYYESLLIPKSFDLIIGVDREGLIQSCFLSKIFNVPYVFFSFEIMFEDETSSKFKKLEKYSSESVSAWFVQDSIRAKQIHLQNQLAMDRCSLLPLASKGRGVHSISRMRDAIGVSLDKKTVLLMGSPSGWSMWPEVLSTVNEWPSDWVLILHGRYGFTSQYIEEKIPDASSLVGTRIFISNSPVNFIDDMGFVLSGINVGLAFYKPKYCSPYTGKNIEFIGLASGKTSTFLKYGIPVIMNEIGEYSELAKSHGFGVVVEDVTNLPQALPKILCDSFSINAGNFFSQKLDFDNNEEGLWAALKKAAEKRQTKS